ncbi:MAG: GNAT family N-acetyltransferase, partial [Planctomycetes bacterium]|nr:GNAT family N-acetyltransferase [Planctomycetota bacterium]
DLETFFEHQIDEVANQMAAFTSKDPRDRSAFDARWQRLRNHPGVFVKTVTLEGQVIGHVASYKQEGQREVTYWIARSTWGKGLATEVLRLFLELEQKRAEQRGVRIVRKSYTRIEADGHSFICNDMGQEVIENWKGQWLNLVVDGSEYLQTIWDADASHVEQAIWSGSPFLSFRYHTALSAEVFADEFKAASERGDSARELHAMVRDFGNGGGEGLRGRRQLLTRSRYAEEGREAQGV